MRVVVRWARLDDLPEVVRRRLVLAGVELGAGQGLPQAARGGLGVHRPLQHLRGGRRAAFLKQLHAGGVPCVHVGRLRARRLAAPHFAWHTALAASGALEVFLLRGIPAAAWSF